MCASLSLCMRVCVSMRECVFMRICVFKHILEHSRSLLTSSVYLTLRFHFRSRWCAPKTAKGPSARSRGMKKWKKKLNRGMRSRTLFLMYLGVLSRTSIARSRWIGRHQLCHFGLTAQLFLPTDSLSTQLVASNAKGQYQNYLRDSMFSVLSKPELTSSIPTTTI